MDYLVKTGTIPTPVTLQMYEIIVSTPILPQKMQIQFLCFCLFYLVPTTTAFLNCFTAPLKLKTSVTTT